MDHPTIFKSAKDKTHAPLILLFIHPFFSFGSPSPHLPKRLTWQVLSQTGEVAWSISGNHAPNTWWPNLSPDFCQLAAGLDTWDTAAYKPDQLTEKMSMNMATGGWGGLGCHSKEWRCLLAGHDFYVCPRDGRSIGLVHKCGGYNHFFCAAWSCETTGDAYWKPTSSWDKIIVQRGWKKPPRNWDPLHPYAQSCSRKNYGAWNCTNTGYCLPLNISFTAHGKQANGWQQGYTWGLRWYISDYDRGIIFKIKLKIENLTPLPVGPNLVLPDQRAPINSGGPVQNVLTTAPAVSSPTPRPKDSSPDTSTNITLSPTTTMPLQPGTGDRLINLIKGAYTALNFSDPNRAKNCWLCLVSSP